MEFYQAYFLCSGASANVELSLDGGQNYTDTLLTLTGSDDSGLEVYRPNGNPNQCNNYEFRQDGYEFISLDLSGYLDEPNLRLRFSYNGLAGGNCTHTFTDNPPPNSELPNSCGGSLTRNVSSSWAIDGLRVPYDPIDTELEWTDEFGVVIANGNTVTLTPVTPGTQQYGVTALVDDCRVDGEDGTQFVTIEWSLAYAGEDFSPGVNECGQSTIDIKAYDNTISANENLAFWNNIMPDNPNNPGNPLFVAPPVLVDDNGTPADTSDDFDTYPTNYPGTGIEGQWSWTAINQDACASFTPTFINQNEARTTFTAPPGEYDLTWTLTNGCSDTMRVVISSCERN